MSLRSIDRTMNAGAAMSVIAKEMMDRDPVMVSATFTRPADTTAYADGDIIYAAVPEAPAEQVKLLKLPNAIPQGGGALIVDAQLKVYSNQTTKLSADLHLFTGELTTAPVDNAPFAVGTSVSVADMAKHLKVISFPNSLAMAYGNMTLYETVPNKVVASAAGSSDLYFFLVARNAYVPVSGEKITVQLSLLPKVSMI